MNLHFFSSPFPFTICLYKQEISCGQTEMYSNTVKYCFAFFLLEQKLSQLENCSNFIIFCSFLRQQSSLRFSPLPRRIALCLEQNKDGYFFGNCWENFKPAQNIASQNFQKPTYKQPLHDILKLNYIETVTSKPKKVKMRLVSRFYFSGCQA